MLKIYEISTDEMREATQDDIDRLVKTQRILGLLIEGMRILDRKTLGIDHKILCSLVEGKSLGVDFIETLYDRATKFRDLAAKE